MRARGARQICRERAPAKGTRNDDSLLGLGVRAPMGGISGPCKMAQRDARTTRAAIRCINEIGFQLHDRRRTSTTTLRILGLAPRQAPTLAAGNSALDKWPLFVFGCALVGGFTPRAAGARRNRRPASAPLVGNGLASCSSGALTFACAQLDDEQPRHRRQLANLSFFSPARAAAWPPTKKQEKLWSRVVKSTLASESCLGK